MTINFKRILHITTFGTIILREYSHIAASDTVQTKVTIKSNTKVYCKRNQ